MNLELKAKWSAALRSGKYVQGDTWLKNSGKYCCLGVLCEVMGHELAEGDRTVNEEGGYDIIDSELPRFRKAFQPHGPDGVQPEASKGSATNFYLMNDTDRMTFDQIADFIDEWDGIS